MNIKIIAISAFVILNIAFLLLAIMGNDFSTACPYYDRTGELRDDC